MRLGSRLWYGEEEVATASEDVSARREPSLGRDAEFPCSRVCVGCGRLTEPREAAPYRPGRAGMRPDPCPHCGEVGLVDLGPATAVLALERALAGDRPGRGSWRRRIARRTGAAGVAIATWGLFLLFVYFLYFDGSAGERGWVVDFVISLTPLMMLVLPGALMAVVALRREWRATTPRVLPARWRFVIADAAPGVAVIAGPLVGEGQDLIAPISGQRCLAFEVGLREDDDGDAPLGSWLFVEQRSAPMRVGACSFDADGVRLDLPRREVPWPPEGPDRARAAHFLRARGFMIEEGRALRIFESRLETGEVVTAALTTAATTATTAAMSAATLRRGDGERSAPRSRSELASHR